MYPNVANYRNCVICFIGSILSSFLWQGVQGFRVHVFTKRFASQGSGDDGSGFEVLPFDTVENSLSTGAHMEAVGVRWGACC